jgi:predicted transcriptional regulator
MSSYRRYPRSDFGSGDAVAKYLGDQQAAIMGILWQRGEATVREVLEELAGDVAYTTVMTMMVRLHERGLLSREPAGRGFRYRPTGTREDFLAELAGSLIDRLVNDFGDAALTRIVEQAERLSPAQLEALRGRIADG